VAGYELEKAARLLEWNRVAQRLSELANSEPGRVRCLRLPFLDDPAQIRRAQKEVSEARELLERGLNIDLSAVRELGQIAKRARVGAALEGAELLIVAGLLAVSRRIKGLLENEIDRLPLLAARGRQLPENVLLEKEIYRRIEGDGKVSDQASEELFALRDRYRVMHAQIHATLDSILNDPKFEDILQERLFTLRNGRYVLPVKHERRGAVEGIVHDISQTGQSLFIEPREITGLNNRLRTAELEIEREIYRVLLELTYKVQAVIEQIEAAVDWLAELDVIFAKARHSMILNAHPVEIASGGLFRLSRVRHPLLIEQLETVVPNDVELTGDQVLLLSGPNTGGKTVLLKTLGLCAMMLRAGLHLPCAPDGRLPLFKRIFAVIGDEQSLERNLSSFSSHVLNLKNIIEQMVPGSLALIDEIGEGTDPRQGIALAKAVLEHLQRHGAQTVVTTHFVDLIAMAQTREGFVNASMAFDHETMTPTFRLMPGLPGRSSALAIAERLGLPQAIIDRARELAAGADSDLDLVISRLDRQRELLEAETHKAELARLQTEELQNQQRKILEDLQARKNRFIAEEREKIKEELSMARATVKNIIRRLQETPSFAGADQARGEIEQIERQVARDLPETASLQIPVYCDPITDWAALAVGAPVFLPGLNENAVLLRPPDQRGRVQLLVKEKRMTLPAADCCLRRDTADRSEAGRTLKESRPAPSPGEPELLGFEEEHTLDLRGQTGEEALENTISFLDQALRRRFPQVFVIHGHGTGTLKRIVRDYLKTSPYAKAWRPGKRGEGSDGVTVVELDL